MERAGTMDAAGTTDTSTQGLTVPAWAVMAGVIVLGTVGHVALHRHVHGVWNVAHIAMAFFLVINLLVNFWELGLFFTADRIRQEWLDTKDVFAGRPMERINEVFAMRIPVTKLLSFKSWTGIWSSYALYDPGYARKGSFGFNIDVGNGFSTILPATFFAFGMTYEMVDPRILGMLGIAMFWQMLYGTIVYFFQFFHAGRHVGHKTGDLWIFVGSTNGLWFIFPIWGIWLSAQLVLNASYAGIFH